MKQLKILITGKGSYIGTTFEKWVGQWPKLYKVDSIDMIDGSWKNKDFSEYDVVFHVAGLAHSDVGNVSDETKAKYYKVNTDLTIETAIKAKTEGVKQFIFMSSAIVYGESAGIYKEKVITSKTEPKPANFYGDSKLQAEIGIRPLADDIFKIVILRPPMIYGKGSKGNYPTLSKFAQKLPVFPNVFNQRSMLHQDNLCEFVRLIINNEESGTFFPQNAEYVKTSLMVEQIAKVHGKKIILTKVFNPFLKIMARFTGLVNKAFGNFVYDKSMSLYDKGNYQIRDFEESIKLTEG
ncbi:MAG: putative NAD-dependent epimerase/dehydratase [Bacillales bacterium]|nr:putative NAD-dependent epimerase/dehydratase [Bacillales bacterium]